MASAEKKKRKRWLPALGVVLAVLVAFGLRLRAVRFLPVDYDEPVYFGAAAYYAQALAHGDLGAVVGYDFNFEHPPLMKLVYGAVLVPQAPINEPLPEPLTPPPPSQAFFTLRSFSGVLGVVNVLIVSLVNPLAGLFLALHSYTVKYTSQIYLEALPMLTSAAAALAYWKSQRRFSGWMLLSALALGLTAASKYIYCVVGIAIALDWAVHALLHKDEDGKRHALAGLGMLIGWGVLAIAAFFAADPYLWSDPGSRLASSIAFNVGYSQGEHVEEVGYPALQPLVWLFTSVPWHPFAIFIQIDGIMALVALIGIRRAWQRQRVMVIWWAVGMLFLLLWSTKWPQYILVVTVPMTLCAGEAIAQIRAWIPDWVFDRERFSW
jgi:hypothetical protein